MRTAREIRSLEDEQLTADVQRLRKTLFDLRNKAARGKPEKTHEVVQTRRELARVLTIINQRRTGTAAAPAAAQETSRA